MAEGHPAFVTALRERAATTPDRLSHAAEGGRLSYGALQHEAAAIARGLARRGIETGDRLALLLPAGLDFVRGFAAAMVAGAVPFAISPGVAPATAMSRAARGRPVLALTTADRLPELAAAAERHGVPLAAIEAVREAADGPHPPASRPVDLESPLFFQLTSGTTGEPRFAMLSHRAIAAYQGQVAGIVDVGPEDVLAGWVPPWHITGLLRFVYLPVLAGAACHLVAPTVRHLAAWLETAAAVRATTTSAPDFALRAAVRAARATLDLSSLRLVSCGGEAVRLSTIVDFENRFGVPGVVRPAYGLAESTLAVTMVRLGEPLAVDARGIVASGRPLPGVELAVVAETGDEVRPGETGEILVRSAALFSGYFAAAGRADALGDGALVDESLRDGWLATGDVGRLDEEGRLFVSGRRRLLLKHGGATFAPQELEEVAGSVAGVLAAAAVALVDRARSGAAGAVVVVEASDEIAPGAARDIAAGVAAAVRRDVGLQPYEVLVLAAGSIPRTESGKLRHIELRRRLAHAEIDVGRLLHGRAEGWTE